MKLTISFKSPDAVHEAVMEAAENDESKYDEISEKLEPWIEYDEYVRVEFDLDAGTATVLPV